MVDTRSELEIEIENMANGHKTFHIDVGDVSPEKTAELLEQFKQGFLEAMNNIDIESDKT